MWENNTGIILPVFLVNVSSQIYRLNKNMSILAVRNVLPHPHHRPSLMLM